MGDVPTIKLRDDHEIPQLGFGVFQIEPENTVKAVTEALKVGYRHVDTAEMYENEAEVGQAITSSELSRDEIWITSKLNNGYHEPEQVHQAIDETLKKLAIDQIDLFLIHWPLPTQYDGDYVSTWNAMIELQANGKAKSIGVSNFQVEHLECLAQETAQVPAINQIELHPYFQNRKVVEYCQARNIAIEAWSPIAQGGVLEDPVITAIADQTSKSAAQVVLRWHIQKGYIVFPKSVTPERIEENFNIFDFELSDDQMAAIDKLDKGEDGRTGPDPDTFDMIPD